MGNTAAHQNNSDPSRDQDEPDNAKVAVSERFEEKSSFLVPSLSSFRLGSNYSTKSRASVGRASNGRTCYSQSKTVWPLLNHEIPFFPEFPVRSVTNEHSFNVISVVSSGAYGKVFRAVRKDDDSKSFAMKIISKSMIFKENLIHQVKTEAQIQVMCDHHPFLVRCHYRWQNKRNLFMVTDYIDGGDLQNIWQETGSFDENLIKIYVAEIALILDFLHNAGIIYRDLKMENILIDNKGHLKLIDFGLSKWLSYGERCHTLCGTQLYMAPEILRLEPYTHSVDWWALGVLMYALLQGKFPFCNVSNNATAVVEFDDVGGQSSSSESARRLVRGLLNGEPMQRLRNLRTLKNHAFYHHFDFESLRSKKIDPLPLLQKQREKRRSFSEETDSNTIDFD